MIDEARNLMSAVASAMNRDLHINNFDDRLYLQKGCYILNSWGFKPNFRYNMYIHGPYSRELADTYYTAGDITTKDTNIPAERITELGNILNKSRSYAEAYATLLMVKNNNPNDSNEKIYKVALNLKPHLKKEMEEAASCLLS